MILPFLPILAKLGLYFLDKLVTDAKKKEEFRLAILESLNRYNQAVLDSAKLRTEYERLKSVLRDGPK